VSFSRPASVIIHALAAFVKHYFLFFLFFCKRGIAGMNPECAAHPGFMHFA